MTIKNLSIALLASISLVSCSISEDLFSHQGKQHTNKRHFRLGPTLDKGSIAQEEDEPRIGSEPATVAELEERYDLVDSEGPSASLPDELRGEAPLTASLDLRDFSVFEQLHRTWRKSDAAEYARPDNTYLTTHWGATWGFVCAVVGFFVAGVILGLLGIIFSGIALGQIAKNPEVYKGQGLAIAGLIIGMISFFGALYLISTL